MAALLQPPNWVYFGSIYGTAVASPHRSGPSKLPGHVSLRRFETAKLPGHVSFASRLWPATASLPHSSLPSIYIYIIYIYLFNIYIYNIYMYIYIYIHTGCTENPAHMRMQRDLCPRPLTGVGGTRALAHLL